MYNSWVLMMICWEAKLRLESWEQLWCHDLRCDLQELNDSLLTMIFLVRTVQQNYYKRCFGDLLNWLVSNSCCASLYCFLSSSFIVKRWKQVFVKTSVWWEWFKLLTSSIDPVGRENMYFFLEKKVAGIEPTEWW